MPPSAFSPASHRACDFHRTRRSINFTNSLFTSFMKNSRLRQVPARHIAACCAAITTQTRHLLAHWNHPPSYLSPFIITKKSSKIKHFSCEKSTGSPAPSFCHGTHPASDDCSEQTHKNTHLPNHIRPATQHQPWHPCISD